MADELSYRSRAVATGHTRPRLFETALDWPTRLQPLRDGDFLLGVKRGQLLKLLIRLVHRLLVGVLAIPVLGSKGASELWPFKALEDRLDDQLLQVLGENGHLAAGVASGAACADV